MNWTFCGKGVAGEFSAAYSLTTNHSVREWKQDRILMMQAYLTTAEQMELSTASVIV